MSRDVNKVILVGRLGTDPVQKETKNGNKVVHFPLATSRRTKSEETGETESETIWHRVVAWGKQGEHCAEYLREGHSVYVEGSVRSRKYEKDGTQRYSFEIYAEQVNFLGNPAARPQVAPTVAPMTTASVEGMAH